MTHGKAQPGPQGALARRAITVTVGGDRMAAFVSVRAGAAAGEPELRQALEQSGVRAGIDERVVARIGRGLHDPAFEISRELIAQGAAPQRGEPGRLESPFADGLRPGHLREDGTLDFHDRELLKPAQAGDEVGRVIAARPGTAGWLVDGTALAAAPARDAPLVLGPGVERDGAGIVRALRSGIVVWKSPASIDVVDRHVHEGPVDLRSGHLHMHGSLLVKGDVQSTFQVYASGDVEILGSVDNGRVYAGGSARIRHAVRGESGSVCSEGDLAVKYAESSSLWAARLLQLGDGVHARCAANRLEVSGRLRGGVAAVEHSAVVREAGSPQGFATLIAAAEPLELPVEAARRALERAKAVRGARSTTSRAPGATERGRAGKGGKAGRLQAALQSASTAHLAERASRRRELSSLAFIQVGFAHPGVTVRIGSAKLQLEREVRAARFSLDEESGEIQTHGIPR